MILKNIVKANNPHAKDTKASKKLVYCLYWLMETESPDSDLYQIAELLLHAAEHRHQYEDLDEMENEVMEQLTSQFAAVRLCYFCCFLSYNNFRELLEDLITQTADAA